MAVYTFTLLMLKHLYFLCQKGFVRDYIIINANLYSVLGKQYLLSTVLNIWHWFKDMLF